MSVSLDDSIVMIISVTAWCNTTLGVDLIEKKNQTPRPSGKHMIYSQQPKESKYPNMLLFKFFLKKQVFHKYCTLVNNVSNIFEHMPIDFCHFLVIFETPISVCQRVS